MEESSLKRQERIAFYGAFPVLFAVILFSMVVAVLKETTKIIKSPFDFFGSITGIILFALVPTIIIILILMYLYSLRGKVTAALMNQPVAVTQQTPVIQTKIIDNNPALESELKKAAERIAGLEKELARSGAVNNALENEFQKIKEDRDDKIKKIKQLEQTIIILNNENEETAKNVSAKKVNFDPNAAPRKKVTLEELLAQVEELKVKSRVTAKMIMKPAQKIEKFKTSAKYRDDALAQGKIITALNWCYERIGNVEYDALKTTKRITEKRIAAIKENKK